jgi:hypothetical protein
MPEHIFNKVVSQLAEINYRGDLSFTLFNEPLADAEIEGKVKAAKKMLPNALLHFNTNGDFLSRERLASINDAGLDRLLISVYVDCDIEKPFDYDAALCATHSMAEKLGLPSIEVYTDPNEDQCLANVKFKDMNILFQSQNHRRQACSRGDVLPESAPVMRTSGRLKPCSFPYSMMCVSHDGKVGACCNIRNDYHEHGKYIVGDLNTESIYQIFLGKKLTDFRKKMINGVNAAPCGTCSFDWESVLMSMHNEPRRTIRKYRFTSL